MTPCPCHHCTDRDPYCHCTCPKYNGWKDQYAAEKKAAKESLPLSGTYARRRRRWARVPGNTYARNQRYKYF